MFAPHTRCLAGQNVAELNSALGDFDGTMLFVSHDRAFLRRIATQIWDFSPLGFQVFSGGYEAYRSHLKASMEQHEAQAQRLMQEREKLEAYVRKYKAGNRATQAHDRERKLARLGAVQGLQREHRMRLDLHGRPAGERRMFLQVHLLGLTYGERTLWRGVDFVLPESGRLGIVGRNGSGKTTLLRALAGEVGVDEGEVIWALGAQIGILRQEVEIDGETPLDALLRQLAIMMVSDGEGALRTARVVVRGGRLETVQAVARAVADSGLSNVRTLDLFSAFNGRRLCENTVGPVRGEGHRQLALPRRRRQDVEASAVPEPLAGTGRGHRGKRFVAAPNRLPDVRVGQADLTDLIRRKLVDPGRAPTEAFVPRVHCRRPGWMLLLEALTADRALAPGDVGPMACDPKQDALAVR